jgi:hypothetical protein
MDQLFDVTPRICLEEKHGKDKGKQGTKSVFFLK